MSVNSYKSVRIATHKTINPSENVRRTYESVREKPVYPSVKPAETYESVRDKTTQPPMNPSENACECVRKWL